MASLKVGQAVARATLTRLVGVRAEAAAAAATLRTTTTPIDVRAAAATDDRAFAAFRAAEADAAAAVAAAAAVCTAAAFEAVVEASLGSGSSSVYSSPVSDFEWCAGLVVVMFDAVDKATEYWTKISSSSHSSPLPPRGVPLS